MANDINQPKSDSREVGKPTEVSLSKNEQPDAKHYTYAEREHKERTESEKMVMEELMQEVKLMEGNEATKNEAIQKAKQIQALQEDEKLKHLLQIAKNKGVVEAIHIAQKTDDPYLLDLLHDILANEGYYKKISK